MTTKEKKVFREKHNISAKDLSTLAKIILTLCATHEKMLETCIELYKWVKERSNGEEIVVDLFMTIHKYTEKQSKELLKQYMAWGNGSLNPEFFNLSTAMRDKLKTFSHDNINLILKKKEILVVDKDYETGNYRTRHVHYSKLTDEEFRMSFTYGGRERTEDEQKNKVEKELGNVLATPVNGEIHTKAGSFSFVYYLKKAMKIVEAETDLRKNKQHVAKLTTALKTAELCGVKIAKANNDTSQ